MAIIQRAGSGVVFADSKSQVKPPYGLDELTVLDCKTTVRQITN